MMADLQDQAIRQHCKALRMPTIGGQFARLADAAVREVRIPTIPAIDSDRNQPPVPNEASRGFR